MSGLALVPSAYGREIGSTNAVADVVAYGITALLKRVGLIRSPTPSSMTTSQGAGITNTDPIITGNSVALNVQDFAGKRYDVRTTITPTVDVNAKKYDVATEVSPAAAAAAKFKENKQFFLDQLKGAKKQIKQTTIGKDKYVPPNVTDDIIGLLESKVGAGGDVDRLFGELQEFVISSYIAENYNSLPEDKKTELMDNATQQSSKFYSSEMEKSGTSDLEKSSFDEIHRKFFNILRNLLTNDKMTFEIFDETKFRKDDPPGEAISLAVINLHYTVTDIINKEASKMGFSKTDTGLSGGSRQNKGMFNYAHFIPLRNRSKKHNYATKIKPNSRHRRRNKTSNKRRSRRS